MGAFSKHVLHSVGFLREGPKPKRRMTRPPGPANGALHSRQRGSEGSRRITRANGRGMCPAISSSKNATSAGSPVSSWVRRLATGQAYCTGGGTARLILRRMASAAPTDRAHARLAELVAALSLGIDLGFGQPMEHVLRQCLIALRLAEAWGSTRSSGRSSTTRHC